MATKKLKPLSQLSPAYAARIRRAAKAAGVPVKAFRRAEGATQKARGHKPLEHMRRRPGSGLSDRQDARVWALAGSQSYRGEAQGSRSQEDLYQLFRERIAAEGMAWFRKLELWVARSHKEWVAAGGSDSIGRDIDLMEEEFDLPKVELFYH
jgi:hypothetical protein